MIFLPILYNLERNQLLFAFQEEYITFFTISAAVSFLALTNVVEPVIHTFPAIFALPSSTPAQPWTTVSNASGLCCGSWVLLYVVDEHVSHAAEEVVGLNVLPRVTYRLVKVFHSTQKQRRAEQVQLPVNKQRRVLDFAFWATNRVYRLLNVYML